ncbi:MAG: transcription-repair coupling factor [Alphaproteobacteria bacterium]|nr:transcription-repair coupling factor [Alphaproteobacteria bacterium]
MIAQLGTPASAEPLVLASLLERHQSLLFIATSDRDMARIQSALACMAPDTEILRLPAWDCLPYDRSSPQASLMAERLNTLAALTRPANGRRLVLTSANALLQLCPPKEAITRMMVQVSTGQTISPDKLAAALSAQGYRRASRAMEPGEFAQRGGIMDIVPAGMSEGIRLDWFGNEVESLRRYDLMTQLTCGTLSNFSLLPASEVWLNDATIANFRTRYRELFGAARTGDALYEAISAGQHYPGMEHWLPLFYELPSTMADYLPDCAICYGHDLPALIDERRETIMDYYQARLDALAMSSKSRAAAGGAPYYPLPPESAFLTKQQWQSMLARPYVMELSPYHPPALAGLKSVLPLVQGQADRTPLTQLREMQRKPTLIACFSEGSRERLFGLLSGHDFFCLNLASWQDRKQIKGKTIGLLVLPLEQGFETDDYLLLSEQDVLGERITRSTRKKKNSDVFMAEAASFNAGELVVHREHGIGRFEGLVTLTVEAVQHDCLKLTYAENARLFLPVENLDVITRYGTETEGIELDRLGGVAWQARAAKLKERITLAAEALMKTAAERLLKPAERLSAPEALADAFAARFPYVETDDQARAIEDVTHDLSSGKPMDRLICGDVGFGKTEVALRAAYAAVMAEPKKQVAVICPTTLLARQHLKNFEARFEGFPVTVRGLSRLSGAKEAEAVKKGLKDGSVDVVIGTHALLAEAVSFARLGLLIIDEEQHFGVAQKEKLKTLKADVHVLTLSATPIPRTLQLALTGVRDLSLITTPPVDRIAVRTFVLPWDPVTLREALMREHHRGGKSFIVTPRIANLAELEAELRTLAPELSFAVAHGQMGATALDKIMNEFYDGKYDALISTSIVESGLDVPTANTLIIHQAHRFGLSQLYQLRGRVGRGKTRAYAYFTLPNGHLLTSHATRRLEVMQSLDHLGAGFTLASHDMDIRGFGNLVGEEQSGHICEVGIELYQQMLQEAVEAIRQRAQTSDQAPLSPMAAVSPPHSVTLNLGLSVLIPESYVPDLELRMGLYRRVGELNDDAEIDAFAAELIDRFGPLPEEVEHLLFVMKLKRLCRALHIEKIDLGPKGAVIGFKENRFPNPDGLMRHVLARPREWKARPDQKLVWLNETDHLNAPAKRCANLHRVLQALEPLIS